MRATLHAIVDLIRRLVGALALVVVVLAILIGATLHLGFGTGNAGALRACLRVVGRWMNGQRTEHMILRFEADADARQLSARTTLRVSSPEEGRRRFYFILNGGLHVRGVRVTAADGRPAPAQAQQLGVLLVVDTGAPVPADTPVEIDLDYAGVVDTKPFGIEGVIDRSKVDLPASAFWYPDDLQSTFTAEVTASLPGDITVLTNAPETSVLSRGSLQQAHWKSDRPVPSFDLVAGRYVTAEKDIAGVRYRVQLGTDVDLDAARVADLAARANQLLTERYGPSGLTRLTVAVDRRFESSHNDGTGLILLRDGDFRDGDYGFAALSREIARNWWGGIVNEGRLFPDAGSTFVVEGLAAFSSLLAVEGEYGAPALLRHLQSARLPAHTGGALGRVCAIDTGLASAATLRSVRLAAAFALRMLRHQVGDEAFFAGLRELLARFASRRVSDRDLQQVLQESSGKELEPFFAAWIRSVPSLDMSLNDNSRSELTADSVGTPLGASDVDLWVFPKSDDGQEPQRSRIGIGKPLPFGADAGYAVLDPQMLWPDAQRANNVFPRHPNPLFIAALPGTDKVAVTYGEEVAGARSSVSVLAGGSPARTWDFDGGILAPPAWAADGATLIVSRADPRRPLPQIVALDADGTRRTIGTGKAPAPASDGAIFAVRGDRVLRFEASRPPTVVVRRPGFELDHPLPSPDAKRLAYTATRRNRLDVRVSTVGGSDDRLLLSSAADRFVYRWAPDGSRLFAIAPGTWDWQIWEIPLEAAPVRRLATDAADIADLALSTNGAKLAFTAAPALERPTNRRRLFVLDLASRTVRTLDLPGADLRSPSWSDESTVVVVTADARPDQPPSVPERRSVKRVRIEENRFEDYP